MSPKPVFGVRPAPAVEAFVAGGEAPALRVVEPPEATPQVAALPAPEAPQAPRRRPAKVAPRLRRQDPGERLAVYLPPELVEALRIRCVRERRSASDAVSEAVSAWMKGYR